MLQNIPLHSLKTPFPNASVSYRYIFQNNCPRPIEKEWGLLLLILLVKRCPFCHLINRGETQKKHMSHFHSTKKILQGRFAYLQERSLLHGQSNKYALAWAVFFLAGPPWYLHFTLPLTSNFSRLGEHPCCSDLEAGLEIWSSLHHWFGSTSKVSQATRNHLRLCFFLGRQ